MENIYTKEGLPSFSAMLSKLTADRQLKLVWTIEDAPSLAVASNLTAANHFYRVVAQKQQDGKFCFATEQFAQYGGTVPDIDAATSAFSSGGYQLFPEAVRWCEMHAALDAFAQLQDADRI